MCTLVSIIFIIIRDDVCLLGDKWTVISWVAFRAECIVAAEAWRCMQCSNIVPLVVERDGLNAFPLIPLKDHLVLIGDDRKQST